MAHTLAPHVGSAYRPRMLIRSFRRALGLAVVLSLGCTTVIREEDAQDTNCTCMTSVDPGSDDPTSDDETMDPTEDDGDEESSTTTDTDTDAGSESGSTGFDPGGAACGNGIIEGSEECDCGVRRGRTSIR